ncbi:MAG: c-type cytochrome domain-containing protein, partial [Pirellulaceae bacterium]
MAFTLKIVPLPAPIQLSLACLLLLPLTAGRAGEPESSFPRQQIDFFERSVRPLLIQHCYECHAQKSKPLRGHFRVDGRGHLLAGGDRGPAIIPGDPEESLLWRAVEYGDEDLQMPPSGKLSDREREIINEWIRLGLP